MRGRDIIGIVLVTFLCLWGTLYLETGMQEFFVLELFIILLMIIVSAGIFYGAALEKQWAWKSAFAFFIFSALNCTFVYLLTRDFVPYAVALLSSVAGIGASALKSGMDFSAGFGPKQHTPKPYYSKPSPAQSHKKRMLDAIKRYHHENPYYESEVMHEEENSWEQRAEENEIPGVQVELETYREEPPIYRQAPKPYPPAMRHSFTAPKPKSKNKAKAKSKKKSKPSKSKAGKTKAGRTGGKKKTTKKTAKKKKSNAKKKR